MRGLVEMVKLRGGVESLTGVLRDKVIWYRDPFYEEEETLFNASVAGCIRYMPKFSQEMATMKSTGEETQLCKGREGISAFRKLLCHARWLIGLHGPTQRCGSSLRDYGLNKKFREYHKLVNNRYEYLN